MIVSLLFLSIKTCPLHCNAISQQLTASISEQVPSSMTMPSSTSSSKRGGLLGPRPQPLKVSSSSSSSRGSPPPSSRTSKKTQGGGGGGAAPVIVYEHTPKVVHARPQEFMTVVQRLTGKPAPAPMPMYVPEYSPAPVEEGAGDHLLLTLGQRHAAVAPLPSPMAAGLLMSPGGFILSPNTMQSIQELTPLF